MARSPGSRSPDSKWLSQPQSVPLADEAGRAVLHQAMVQISQGSHLSITLQTTLEAARAHLQVDRLVLYSINGLDGTEAFTPGLISGSDSASGSDSGSASGAAFGTDSGPDSGARSERIGDSLFVEDGLSLSSTEDFPERRMEGQTRLFEVRSSPKIVEFAAFQTHNAVNAHNAVNDCGERSPACQRKFRSGSVLVVPDIEVTYQNFPCLLNILRPLEVRAKLATPVILPQGIWGLLIAHQCFTVRQWEPWEQQFLDHLATYVAIALHQNHLQQRLAHQTQTLEKQVLDQTQALRDALIAAQSAERTKNAFLSIISHELRTPLTYILGMSETLLRWPQGQSPEKHQAYLQKIHDSGDRLLGLINDMLDLSQLEAGKESLELSQFSLTQMARQVYHTLGPKAQQKGIVLKLELQVKTGQDLFVADQRRVAQILLNLLSNAIKFTPPDGRITLRLWCEGNGAVLQVEDTGIGIPEQQQRHLFEKFQQLDTSHQRQYEGAGLGLALTKQLVDLHRGRIDVKSALGMGTVFTVRLPGQSLQVTNPSQNLPRDLSEPTPSMMSKATVVLIEEEEENALLICGLLTAAGYKVVWMVDGYTAIQQVTILQPLLLILTLSLTSLDGYDMMRMLRGSLDGQHMKILALVATLEEGVSCCMAGADSFLLQPLQPDQLLPTVSALTAADLSRLPEEAIHLHG